MPFREQTPRSETVLWTERQLNAWMQWNSSMSRKVLEHSFSHLNKKVTGYQTQKGHMGWRDSVSTVTDMLLYISAVYTIVNWNLDVWMVICALPATMALLFVPGPTWAGDKTPACHEFISGVLHASYARQTIWVSSGCALPLTWRADQSAVQFKSSKSSQYRSAHEEDTDTWLQNQGKMHTASGDWSEWGLVGDLLACLNACEWGLTCQC